MFSFILLSLFSFTTYADAHHWKQYPYQDPNSTIRFPEDEGTHNIVKGLEWWYVVIHAQGRITKDRYSILVSHFNNQTRFFNVTNVTKKSHVIGTTFGVLKSQKGYLDISHETPHGVDILKTKKNSLGELIPFQYEMKTHFRDMRLEAEFSPVKRPAMIGLDGYGPVGSSGQTWYYSFTRMEIKGRLTYNGITEPIEGTSWLDHQWGPFFVSPVEIGKMFESYEWFCVQLDNNHEIMISNIYNKDNQLPTHSDYGDVQIVDPDGESKIASFSLFNRNRYWQDPKSKKYFSMGWELQVPEWDLNLKLTPEYENQMVSFPLNGDFWEGSIKTMGSLEGKNVKGKAFGELVHYFKIPQIKVNGAEWIDLSRSLLGLRWSLKNPDEGNPLHYKIVLETPTEQIVLKEKILETFMKLDLSPYTQRAGKFRIKILGCSVDEFICGETLSDEISFLTQRP